MLNLVIIKHTQGILEQLIQARKPFFHQSTKSEHQTYCSLTVYHTVSLRYKKNVFRLQKKTT